MSGAKATLIWSQGTPGAALEPPIVSVIVVSYRVRELLQLCLKSIFEELGGLESMGLGQGEVLVVDNRMMGRARWWSGSSLLCGYAGAM